MLSTADMVVQRRDGPRRLREIDDDDEYYFAVYKNVIWCCHLHFVENIVCFDSLYLTLHFNSDCHYSIHVFCNTRSCSYVESFVIALSVSH